MLPNGFKKDSRVWLHKNASTFPKKASPFGRCDCDGQRIGSDDPYECLPQGQFNGTDPIITDTSGRIYKKDSRIWLHKSSKKKLKPMRGGDLMEEMGNRMGWRHEIRGLSVGEAPEGVVRTRSSTELIRAQAGANKIKKKRTMMLMSMMMNPPVTGGTAGAAIPETRPQLGITKYRSSVKHASYHDVSGTGKGCTTVSAFASDLCIANQDRSPSRFALQGDFVDSCSDDNNDIDDVYDDDDNDDDEDEDMEGDLSTVHFPLQRLGQDGLVARKGGIRRAGWNHSTVEVTRDGLRELERMMKEQNQRRSAHLAMSLHDPSRQTPGCDVSPESLSSDSRVSLDANTNLSEEIAYGRESNQSQNSTEQQLTRATEYLHVCSPDRQPTKRSNERHQTRPI